MNQSGIYRPIQYVLKSLGAGAYVTGMCQVTDRFTRSHNLGAAKKFESIPDLIRFISMYQGRTACGDYQIVKIQQQDWVEAGVVE